ncbi:inositol monophosphatase family protein [Shimia ponticola]|uniref:inositol monophosphatase family protein n=1 Tax=Shimia ponticola TaxID=2582893 RepID=UPI0011BE4DE5|nr:inositol monophosphatase family protein [Shimia ponticola]
MHDLAVSSELQAAVRSAAFLCADAAAEATLPHFRTAGLVADNKLDGDYDPVTVADRNAEIAIRQVLAEHRPDDAIIGEELDDQTGTSGVVWVIDPIDGTRGFVSGTPTWGTLIAAGTKDGPQFGIIDQPYIKDRFVGGFGEAWCDGPMGRVPLRTRAPRDLSQATVFTTFPEVGTTKEQAAFHTVADQAQLVRYGMDCYAYALLAGGHIDLVIEAGLNSYDIQAPIAVVQAAGGIVTDWSGEAAHHGGRAIAAANAEIHAQALAILKDCMNG